jgi:hypothetical protein
MRMPARAPQHHAFAVQIDDSQGSVRRVIGGRKTYWQ